MGNIELLKEVKNRILLDPKAHDQESWFCETTMCIAGHAAVQAGAKLRENPMYPGELQMVDYFGNLIHTPEFAQEKLGLTEDERTYLFYCMDNQVALKRVDQVLQLWEEGKTIDSAPIEDLIPVEEEIGDPRTDW